MRATKVSLLAEFLPLIGRLREDPLADLVLEMSFLRPELSGLFAEMHHSGARFEDRDRSAAAHRFLIDYHRHLPVGRNLEKA